MGLACLGTSTEN